MAGPDSGPAIPVWLAEDDLGCIICQELLAWPATLPCGHSFCRKCLMGLWSSGRRWSCPTCREGAAQPLELRKNTMLQDLADKYSRAVEAHKSIAEVGRELAELVEQLVDIVRSLQRQRHIPESGADNQVSILAEDPRAQQPYPCDANEEGVGRGAISPTFDLGSLSCSLEVSEDHRTVTVSHYPQPYPWSHERFASCQALCSQALSSGRQYWEVDTQHCSHWAVGVASQGMRRDQILGRTRDSWCVEWKGTSQLSVWHMAKETVLCSDRPNVVGIWLDLEEGKLAFYSMANQEKLLYECPISASFPLHPAFWLYGLNPGNSLSIREINI
ncbi:E3 ubiquitin-protein ligase RNF135 [Camelus dromedarius]|uniref:E3 ubiquitin-protein ligase RNF135 n=1 Tax=Camelus dromedarius TaxID=9838 RepID=A0A5N4D5D2_CAMDR|nr:E3 ubiquitin-protein ligase RNF135 [Camelus dromedarius]